MPIKSGEFQANINDIPQSMSFTLFFFQIPVSITESFYVIEGEITVSIDEKTVVGNPGSFVQIPRTVPHAVKINSDKPVRMLIQCAPAGFDEFMLDFATELPSIDRPVNPSSEAEIAVLLPVAPKYGHHILPPREHSTRPIR